MPEWLRSFRNVDVSCGKANVQEKIKATGVAQMAGRCILLNFTFTLSLKCRIGFSISHLLLRELPNNEGSPRNTPH